MRNMKPPSLRALFGFVSGMILLIPNHTAKAGNCTNPPPGLVSWWQGESNALDTVGPNNGTLNNGVSFVGGEVGQSFSFDGTSSTVQIPDSPSLSFTNALTVELWYKDGGVPAGAYAGLVAKRPLSGPCNFGLTISPGNPGSFLVYFLDPNYASYQGSTFSPLPPAGSWHHLAASYRQVAAEQIEIKSFIDGQLVKTATNSGSLARTVNNSAVYIGCSNPPGGEFFKGAIDEVSIYSRALLDSEIAGIFAAQSAGKCVPATPPGIYAQPLNQNVFVGQAATFSVSATGTVPLAYQWNFKGTDIVGATTSQLVLTNVQMEQAGAYSVEITNTLGAVLSSNAELTVYPLQSGCVAPPAGIVGWWPAEDAANDLVGTNNGIFQNPEFATGEVGQAFNFDGSMNNIRVPASRTLDIGRGAGMTVEAWINPKDNSVGRPIAEWAPGPTSGGYGVHFYANATVVGALYANVIGTDGSGHVLQSSGALLTNNGFQHVALTYDKSSGVARLFVNGAVVAESTIGTFTPQTSADMYIGYRPNFIPFGPVPFKGEIDEIALYSRALSPNEVQAIYGAGAGGKCGPPTAPQMVTQPVDQTAMVSQTASFTAYASGARPLSYQWIYNGTTIPGATDTTLVLTNVQSNQAGMYAVQVTNLYGLALSSNANLTVTPAPACAPPPSGLVSWWPGNGDASDATGGQNGIFTNPEFATAEVGQGFKFDGTGNNIRVPAAPSLDVGQGTGLTIEAWIDPTDASKANPIVEWAPGPSGGYGVHFYAGGSAELYANLYSGGDHVIASSTGVLTNGGFQHVALTYDKFSGSARLFLNGVIVAQSLLGTFIPKTSGDVYIGYRPNFIPNGPYFFIGVIDEVSIYSRALTNSEVQAIYAAGVSGKCSTPMAPSIFSQPADFAITQGQNASFFVDATGSSPLTYQWSFKGTNIPGATNASLVLTNVQMSQAGNYSVQVTNLYGSALSSNAALVVNFPPASVNVVNSSGSAGHVVTVPVVLVANGNENAIGFSLNYSPTLLTSVGVSLGTGATGGALQFNTNQAGAVGVAVALSSGGTFAPGTQEVAEVSFMTPVAAQPYSVALSFGDQPTKRELSDPTANLLGANFNGGHITLSRSAFEADVAPRPDGDGAVTIVDWVQVGRYVAALDSPTNASEFQRADCAPRSTMGDGLLTVSDWVQAGRYAAGLDPLTAAGGPTAPSGPGIARPFHKEGTDPLRTIMVQGAVILQGQTTGTALVELNAQGDENAIGLSLGFDPTVVSYTSASLGADAASATMDINSNQATNGQLGIIMALPTDTSFSPGTRQVLKINFRALTTNSVNSTVALTDLPVRREVADTNALPVVATYANGTIAINPKPSLAIAHSNQNIGLTWPFWATNYLLQQAVGNSLSAATWTNLTFSAVLTNNSLNVTVPLSGSVQFYRLQHQ